MSDKSMPLYESFTKQFCTKQVSIAEHTDSLEPIYNVTSV